MKRIFDERSRESSGVLRSGNRKYFKRGMSPDASTRLSSGQKSTQEMVSQIVPHLLTPNHSNMRYSDKKAKMSSSKIGSREDCFLNYELLGLSHSKNFLADRRKKGKSSYYKKITDVSNNSEAFFSQQKVPTTKEVSKGSSHS